MVTTAILGETRTLLENISWQTFKAMLAEMGSNRKTRIAYDNGIVEIMTPLLPHEGSNRSIERFIVILFEELDINFRAAGSLTLTRDDLERGSEPDSSYYIQNERLVRSKENIDLATDPPPDLVLEIEYSRSAIDKLLLYAAMGVPEFWRYRGGVLRIYTLNNGEYVEVKASPSFPGIAVTEIPRFIQQSRDDGELAVNRAFRAWVRQQIAG
jgi:Uma2 family endonuclease